MTAIRLGRVVFRPTHARFAADLLDDCRAELLSVTTAFDFSLERAMGGRLRTTAPTAYTSDNREKLVGAAAYAQWISDHVRRQAALWQQADTASAAGYYAGGSDQRALIEHQQHEQMARFYGVAPPKDPPPRPGELEGTETLRADSLDGLERAWEWCGTAFWAAGMSSTGGMKTVNGHIGTLLSWLERQNPST